MITVEPIGGLANRMRVIATAKALSIELNRPLTVIWNENYELNCPFNKLFNPIPHIKIISKTRIHGYFRRSMGSSLWYRLRNFALGINYCITEEDYPFQEIKSIISCHKHVYIKTCQCLNGDTSYYNLFNPTALIQAKVDSLTKYFDVSTIGVQIRRTDNSEAIAWSPTEMFIAEMNAILTSLPYNSFFLTTDDAAIESELKQLFGERIYTHTKQLSRNTQQGIMDAVADLFTLSKTSMIIGSYWSSFSEVAAIIGKLQLKVIKSNKTI